MANNNVRIQLELVDGPAQKALSDFIKTSGAADKSVAGLNKSIGGLSKGVDSTSTSFSGFAKIITDDLGGKGAQSVGQLSSLLGGPLLVALGAVAAAGLVVKQIFDLTLVAERNEQIANSFNAIAESAGLAGDSLKEGLLAATKGLADDDDVLQAANKSIIELGTNADKIPEIMEVARKSTALFGGDLIQNFENLSQALASGNTKALRNIGLIIDAEAAQRKYAESLGVTVAQLSDSGKKQAVTNAALDQAKEKFKGVDETSNTATQAFERFKVSAGGLYDGFARVLSQSTLLSGAFNILSKALHAITPEEPLTILEEYNREIVRQQANVDNLTRTIDERNAAAKRADESMFKNGDSIRADVKSLEAQRTAYINVIDQKKAYISALDEEKRKRGTSAPADKVGQVNDEALLKDRTENAKKAADAQLAIAQSTAELESEILRNKLATQQITQEEFNAQNAALEQSAYAAKFEVETQRFVDENTRLEQARATNLITEASYQTQRDALASQFAAKGIKYDADSLKSKTKLNQEEQKLQQQKVSAVKDTFGNLSSLMQTSSRELFAIGKAAAIASSTINTYEAITKTMASVPYPFNIPLAVAQGIAGFVQVANIASTNPSFAQGGIVPGTSYTGDRVTANVNSGEMVLNRQQQSNLFSQIKGGGGGDMSETNSLLRAMASRLETLEFVANVDGREIVRAVNAATASGTKLN